MQIAQRRHIRLDEHVIRTVPIIGHQKTIDLPPLEDERPPLSEEHERQRCRFLGIPYDPVAAEKLRGMRRWYIWNKRAMDARDKARGFARQDNEPPVSPGTPADEPDSGSDEQHSAHYWSRYPPD